MFCDMKRNGGIFIVSVAIAVFTITACATIEKQMYHGYLMKGSVIDANDSEIVICIGKKDGATVGQELDAYHINRSWAGYQKVYAGKIRIAEIIDEHFSKAKVQSGKVGKGDIVELLAP